MTIRHWATACKLILDFVKHTEPEFKYYLYVNYPEFVTTEAQVQERSLWIYEEESQNYTMISILQRMFPCSARAATIPSVLEYDYPYTMVFWIYPVLSSWMLIQYKKVAYILVEWINIDLHNQPIVSPQLFSQPLPKSTINDPPDALNELMYNNAKYLIKNPKLVI